MHVARSMHPLSDKRTKPPRSHPVYLEHTEFPPLPPLPLDSPPHPRAVSPFPPPRILLPADACNSPMLNATFASLHLREAPRAFSSPRESPANPPLTPRATVCVQFTHLVRLRAFITRAQALYRLVSIMSMGGGHGEWRGRIGTTEERVTMRTRRQKIGRHACMHIRTRVHHRAVGRAGKPANVQVPCE